MQSLVSSIDKTNTGAQGDCTCLSENTNRTRWNSIIDKNISHHFDYTTEHCFRSNLASGEPEENQGCVSTSSATFIVSSSEITIEQNEDNLKNINTNRELVLSTKGCHNDQQQHLWYKEHWISMTIITGIIMIFIIILTTIIILF